MAGEAADWGLTEHLLALLVDGLRSRIWQEGGGKGTKPKPMPRPGVEDDSVQRFKARRVAANAAELRARLAAKWTTEEVGADGG